MSLREFISGLDLRKKKIVDSRYIIDKDSIFNLDLLFGFNMGLEYKSRVLNYARIKKNYKTVVYIYCGSVQWLKTYSLCAGGGQSCL